MQPGANGIATPAKPTVAGHLRAGLYGLAGLSCWRKRIQSPECGNREGGTIDLTKAVPPDSFDPPLVWMPQEFDNSSGGQLFVDDPRWGPLAGRLMHT